MRLVILIFLFTYSSIAQIQLTMDGGSSLTGTPDFKELSLKTGFGKLSIPLSSIVSVDRDKKVWKVTLSNGGIIFGQLSINAFNLSSSLGKLAVNINRISKIVVLKNKELLKEEGWSKTVNGLGMKVSSSKLTKVGEDSFLNLTLKVKNFTKRTIFIPYPDINGDSYSDIDESNDLFYIEYKKLWNDLEKEMEVIICGGGMTELRSENCQIMAGGVITVNIKVKILKEEQLQELEEEFAKELKDTNVFDLESQAILKKGKYQALITMKNFFQSKVWIVDHDGSLKEWMGVIEVKSTPFEVK